jgi:hypothetical protein
LKDERGGFGVKGRPKGKFTLQTSLFHRVSLVMNKEASYLRSHLAILHQKKTPIHLLCDGGKTHFIA